MPTYYARKSGNINATDVWATTPSGTAASQTFAAGDVLVSNSFTITVNVSTDLGSAGEVRNDTTGGATAGGSFSLSNGVTLTANVVGGATNVVTLAGTAAASIVGNITGGSTTNVAAVSHTSSATLTVTGSVTAGGNGWGISAASATTGNTTVTGNVTASSNGRGISSNSGTITVVGNVTGGSGGSALGIQCYGGSVTVTGTVTGGSGAAGIAVEQAAIGGTVTGTVVGAAQLGLSHANANTSTVTVTRAKGGPLATSAAGVAGSTSGITIVEEIEYGDTGASPTSGPIRLSDKTSNVAVMYRFGTTKKNLVDTNASGNMPAASNVRSGVSYNGGNSVGTCAVPAASSVAFGVLVDNTTGTAALTPAAVWDYLTTSANTANSMGERLKNAATVASVGQALADALTP